MSSLKIVWGIPILLITSLQAQSHVAMFPGEPSEVPSPDGHWVLRNVDGPGQVEHHLFLEEKNTGAKREVYFYQRSLAVVWSPDSRHFAVNDFEVSNIAEAYILGVRESDGKIDLQKQLQKKESFRRVEWDHGYVAVSKWLDDRRVVILFWGHGGSPTQTFCQCYVYTLNGTIAMCRKQPHGGDLEQECGTTTP